MTRTHVSLFTVAVAGLALVAGGVSFAQTAPPGPPGVRAGRQATRMAGPMGRFRGLDLTEAQRDQLKALADARRERGAPAAAKVRELNQKLQAELFADAPDQGTIEQLKTDLNLAQKQALDERVAAELEMAAILTPEQRQQLREGGAARGRFGRRGARGTGWMGR